MKRAFAKGPMAKSLLANESLRVIIFNSVKFVKVSGTH